MNAYEVYIEYLALKRHFTVYTYDYLKYNGKVRTNVRAFEKRNDIHHFKKIAQHKNPKTLLLSNIYHNPEVWIGKINSSDGEFLYNKYLKYHQSLFYNFRNEIDKLEDDYNSNFIVRKYEAPPLLKLHLQGKVSGESLIVLNKLSPFFKYWNNNIEEDIIWPGIYLKLLKFSSFFRPDLYKYRENVIKHFQKTLHTT